MEYVIYAKVRYYNVNDQPVVEESFLQAAGYGEAVEKIEKYYGEDLIAFQVYAFGNSMLYVSDIQDYLEEARDAFKE